MTRVLDVARIQLVNWPTLVAYPLAMPVLLPLLGLLIDIANGETATGPHETFLLPMLLGVAAAGHLQTMTQVFPFTLGLGVTRRQFAAATALVVTGQAALLGLVLLALDAVERLTGGWGRDARIFGLGALHQDGPLAQWAVYTVPIVATSAICVLAGAVFQRWHQTGIYLAVIGAAALLAGLKVILTAWRWWPPIAGFLGDQSSLTLFAAVPLVLALAFGGVAWLVLRRATT